MAARFEDRRLAAGNQAVAAPHPDAATTQRIIDLLFWASLHQEEGRVPRVSVAFLPPDLAHEPVVFKQRLPFIPRVLARLGPAVEGPGIHLAICGEADGLYLWGIVSRLPALSFVVEVIKPGLLVVKASRSGTLGKFSNVAVLEGERFKLADEGAALRPDGPPIVEYLLRSDPALPWPDRSGALVRLALAMRAHGHGGLLLLVPNASERWRSSVVWPSSYSLKPPFARLAELMRRSPRERYRPGWSSALDEVLTDVAGMTAVDGAVVMRDDFEVLGFGMMIERAPDREPVGTVVLSEPFSGGDARAVTPAEIGNSRHLAAAQFIHDQREGTALVASQDGPFTVFTYSEADQLVHADRIDGLLL